MEIIDQIRQVAALVDIASQYTTLKKRGSKFVGLCPFHSEKDPSFTVDPEKHLYHCFGCGAGGDVFTLIMEKENLSFPEAMKFLAQKYNIPLPQPSKISAQALKLEERLFQVNSETLAFYRKCLFQTPEGKKALEYLGSRGVTQETIETLKVGYAPNAWTSLLDYFRAKAVSPDLLLKAGLVLPGQKKDGFYDRFRGRVVFPIFNLTGKVVAFGGRAMFDQDPKYLNSPETPVYSKGKVLYGLNFTKDAVRDKGELILVEGYTDFLALFQGGFGHCAASLGTSFTPYQAALAQRFAPRLIISYDGDAAGQAASLRAVSICLEKGIHASVVVLPAGLDPDSFMKKHGPEEFAKVLDRRLPGLKFMIELKKQGRSLKTPEEKAKLVREVLQELDKIPDAFVQDDYATLASQYLGVDERLLRSQLQKRGGEKKRDEDRDFFLPAEKRLLQILIARPDFLPDIFAEVKDGHFAGLRAEPVFRLIHEGFRKEKDVPLHELAQNLTPGLAQHLTKALLEPTGDPTFQEAQDCLDALWEFSLKKRRAALQAEIVRAEKQGDNKRVSSLQFQKQDIDKQIRSL